MEAHEKALYVRMLGAEPSAPLIARHQRAKVMAERAGMDHLMPQVCLLLAVDEAVAEDTEEAEDTKVLPVDWKSVEHGTRVIAKWRGKERGGKLLEVAGRTETGKLRIRIDRDPDKKDYREIAQENVRLA